MNFSDLLKNYSKSVLSSQILKSPYEEIYNQIFLSNKFSYESILIINQGVYVPLAPYFEQIFKKEYNVNYIDNNELSINQLNQELVSFKNNHKKSLDIYVQASLSNIYNFKNIRSKDIQYDTILIHHYNSYIEKSKDFFNVLKSITHNGTQIILFASICTESSNTQIINYKNNIRKQLSNITNMDLGILYSLEDIILSVPQEYFKIKHITPYRESHYIGYGKNIIYKFILEKE